MEKGERGKEAWIKNKEQTASRIVGEPKKMSFQKLMSNLIRF